jgi:hypothetical protein
MGCAIAAELSGLVSEFGLVVLVLRAVRTVTAVRKAAGFASHSAHNFCSFCTCTKENVKCLDPRQWTYRDHWSCRNYALQWLDAKTKVLRTALFKLHGVRWSSLYRLAYRDHVKHTMLGIMHCWLEGVLQHHTRYLWGIGDITPSKKKSTGMSSHDSHNDSADSGLETDTTEVESDADQEEKEKSEKPPKKSVFTKAQLQQVRAAIAEVKLPTWVERPPTNLGEKRHGKLKADHWLTLYTVILPMALVKIWGLSNSPRDHQLLVNAEQLVICTQIACSYSTSDADADLFDQVYSQYRQGLQELFPNIKSKPNHH